MADVPAIRNNIQVAESQFRAAVSESTIQKIGGSVNFINTYQVFDKCWFLNGAYYALSTPFLGVDGLIFVPGNVTISSAFMFTRHAGSSGSTSLDIKYATTPGGSFTSVFSTVPVIAFNAGDFAWCYNGSAFANTTAPVIGTPNIAANSVLRMDLLSSQGGTPAGCGIVLFFQPR